MVDSSNSNPHFNEIYAINLISKRISIHNNRDRLGVAKLKQALAIFTEFVLG